MTDGQPSGRSRWGTPASFVLYRTPERWRYAVHLRDPASVMDGFLPDTLATAAVEEAQAELHRRAELAHGWKFQVHWETTAKPDWWTAEITDMNPPPGDQLDGP
ncbi:hypothetical protein ABIA39_008654 [Nocardia sp. GAS34]|uniref:hypothetical protein n=1 Tax=unclassified Nocardia TaxID=2637762 RepID=UPI003D19C71D